VDEFIAERRAEAVREDVEAEGNERGLMRMPFASCVRITRPDPDKPKPRRISAGRFILPCAERSKSLRMGG
jgi:hypothetical protein